jgi:hypothetical protein
LPLTLNGGEVKTYKNNGTDIWSARLYYRVYPTDSPSGSFTAVNLPFTENLTNPGDQKWATSSATIDLLNGLSDGNYTLEIYYEASTNNVDAPATIYDNNGGANYNATFTVASAPPLTDARAMWLDTTTLAWNGATGNSYKLLYDPDGGIVPAVAGATACAAPPLNAPCYVTLTPDGPVSGYIKNPNATGLTKLVNNSLGTDLAKALLRGQTAVASYDDSNTLLQISGVQLQSVLDHLYVDNGPAENASLGVTYSGNVPTVRVWAPTAQSVTLRRYADSTTSSYTSHPMTRADDSGVWSVTGDSSWDRAFYLLDVQVYTPAAGAVANNLVTDPYAVSLSTDSLRSQFVNLDDADLKPTNWDSYAKPALNNFEDITIYEMHVRDFSINDSTVAQANRGTYVAFTYDGQNGRPGPSNGMAHLLALQDAGLTHVHLLPAFDIASVPEASVPRTVWPNPTGYPRDSDQPQSIIGATAPPTASTGATIPSITACPKAPTARTPTAYSASSSSAKWCSALNQNGLRVVMDVVYNHTAASGQGDKSVLDKVVPGYYHRYDANGASTPSSCCDDTASEYAMMEKLMIDTLVRFAVDYKVDGFRFDLMNLHTRRNMENVQAAINAVDPTSTSTAKGWTFGSAQAKGFTDNLPSLLRRQVQHDRHGHRPLQRHHPRRGPRRLQRGSTADPQAGLHQRPELRLERLRVQQPLPERPARGHGHGCARPCAAAAPTGTAQGSPFTDDPQESVNYVEKHDNETLCSTRTSSSCPAA